MNGMDTGQHSAMGTTAHGDPVASTFPHTTHLNSRAHAHTHSHWHSREGGTEDQAFLNGSAEMSSEDARVGISLPANGLSTDLQHASGNDLDLSSKQQDLESAALLSSFLQHRSDAPGAAGLELEGKAQLDKPPITADNLDKDNMRRVLASSIIGNTLEWYDFLVYTYLGTVISRLFFPPSSTYTRLLAFYGIFAAGFLTRPLGAATFGRIGDKYGRKTALTLSIYLMSIPTALVGCLPTYKQAGLAAPILLVLCRVLQGFAVGGEFTATMVFLVEHAPPAQAGLYGSAAFASVMVGVLMGSGIALFFNYVLSDEALYSWGWRLPFLISIIGAAVGVYIRRHLKEPELDGEGGHGHGHGKAGPLRKVFLAIGTVIMVDFVNAIGFYLIVIFLPIFFQEFCGMHRQTALLVHTSNMLLYMLIIPVGGWLSDRYGRVPVLAVPCLVLALAGYPLWLAFVTKNVFLAWLAQFIQVCCLAIFSGVLPATFVALFPAEYRCTGLSIGHNLSMAAFGGTAPIIATAVLSASGGYPASPAGMIVAAAVFSVLGALMVRRLFHVR